MSRLGIVTVVGVGLIGGSIGKTLRSRGLAARVLGVGRDPARLDEARDLGAIDEGCLDLAVAAAESSVVVVCTPVDRIAEDVRNAACAARPTALITDAGSTKAAIVATAEADPESRSRFVGAHPLAGSERNGVAHASEGLFDGRVCVLTPTASTPPDRLELAGRFWSALGCRVRSMSPADHDRALARTSHLPHVVAAALAAAVPPECLPLAAGAYRDTTRVAGSDPALWAAIFEANRDAVLEAVDAFAAQLGRFRRALTDRDLKEISEWLAEARHRRMGYVDESRAPEPPTSHAL